MAENITSLELNGITYAIGKSIYAELDLSLERFVELLGRDFYCPTLDSAPTAATRTYFDTDGSSNTFQTGQPCRWQDSDGLYRLAVLKDMTETSASWYVLPVKASELTNDTGYVQALDPEEGLSPQDVVKDAVLNGERISFRTHASATLTSRGYTVDDTLDDLEQWSDFYRGCNKVNSVANIPSTKRLVVAEISSDASFSMASIPSSGKDVHIMIHNTGSSEVVVTLPVSGGYVNTAGSELTVDSYSWAEVNVISDGTIIYIRGI